MLQQKPSLPWARFCKTKQTTPADQIRTKNENEHMFNTYSTLIFLSYNCIAY